MKKTTLLAATLFFTQFGFSQIQYAENFESGLNEQIENFYDDTDFVCDETNPAIYTNLYDSAGDQDIARYRTSVITPNDQATTLSFTYSVADYEDLAPVTYDWGTLDIKYALENSQEWILVKTLTAAELSGTANCETYTTTLAANALPEGQNLELMFEWHWNSGDWLFLFDDLTITQETASETPAFDKTKLNLYPNPVEHTLHISYEQPITHYTIFDITGRKLQDQKTLHQDLEINVTHLNQGTYFIYLQTAIQEEIVRFIKK